MGFTSCNVTIRGSEFNSNIGGELGGVLSSEISTIMLDNCNFTNNISPVGAIVFATQDTKIQYRNYLLINNNSAYCYAVIYLSGSEFRGHISGNFSFLNNFGSLLAAADSNMSF